MGTPSDQFGLSVANLKPLHKEWASLVQSLDTFEFTVIFKNNRFLSWKITSLKVTDKEWELKIFVALIIISLKSFQKNE